jgi:nickel transport protein
MKPLLLVLLLLAGPAQAHKLKLFVTTEGPVILGDAYFSGGDKAQGISGEVRGLDGRLAGTITTGTDGSFRFTAASRMDHVISVDGGDGHSATATVAAADLPASLPAGTAAVTVAPQAPPPAEMDAVEAAVARQIRPLRQQLDAYEDKLRLHDILGGIGTIFGVFGVLAWISAQRKSP